MGFTVVSVMLHGNCCYMLLLYVWQIDEDLTARINMADYKFSFHERGKVYNPAWMAPEGKQLMNMHFSYNLLTLFRTSQKQCFSSLTWQQCLASCVNRILINVCVFQSNSVEMSFQGEYHLTPYICWDTCMGESLSLRQCKWIRAQDITFIMFKFCWGNIPKTPSHLKICGHFYVCFNVFKKFFFYFIPGSPTRALPWIHWGPLWAPRSPALLSGF